MAGNHLLDIPLAVCVYLEGRDDDRPTLGADDGVICLILHILDLLVHVLILLLKV